MIGASVKYANTQNLCGVLAPPLRSNCQRKCALMNLRAMGWTARTLAQAEKDACKAWERRSLMVSQMRRSCEANTQLSPNMRDQLSGLSIGKKDLAVRPKAKGMRGGLIVEMKSHASRAKNPSAIRDSSWIKSR